MHVYRGIRNTSHSEYGIWGPQTLPVGLSDPEGERLHPTEHPEGVYRVQKVAQDEHPDEGFRALV